MLQIKKFGLSQEEIARLEESTGRKLSKKQKKKELYFYEHRELSDEAMLELEAMIDAPLPSDYKSFLKKNNGGTPNKSVILDRRVVNFFLGFYNNSNITSSIEWHLKIYENRYPTNLLPIASAGGGDLILMNIKGENYSKIYYWDHQLENEQSGREDDSNLTYITHNFNQFLLELREEP